MPTSSEQRTQLPHVVSSGHVRVRAGGSSIYIFCRCHKGTVNSERTSTCFPFTRSRPINQSRAAVSRAHLSFWPTGARLASSRSGDASQCAVERAEGNGGRGHAAEWDFPRSKPPGFSMRCQKRRRAPVPFREHCGNNLAATSLLAGRRTCTREEFCVAVSFIIAGVLLPRPAHTKTTCVGFRETQRPRVQIPLSWNSFIQFGYSFFARAKKV